MRQGLDCRLSPYGPVVTEQGRLVLGHSGKVLDDPDNQPENRNGLNDGLKGIGNG